MPDDYDAGKTALDALIRWAEANAVGGARNEATTRLHLIDEILTSVLRWPRSSIRAEEPAGSGRIDYALGSPAVQLIVEAKREGVYFELPAGTRTGVHSIESLTSGATGKPLREALLQVIGYSATNGVGPAAVTNGHQLVVILGTRTDGVPPLAGRALVFADLNEMRQEFRVLWDNLSPAAIEEKRIYRSLRVVQASPPEPLSAHLANYPGIKWRNDLQAGLDILAELFLEDVARLEELRADFLRDCYASSGALSQYAEVSREILKTRYALLQVEGADSYASAQTKRGISPQLSQDMLAAAASRRPIVLLGDVGVGKTTFIQRLVHVDAKDVFDEAITLYIDLGSTTTLTEIDTFVTEELIRQLRLHYEVDIEEAEFAEKVHRDALKRFDTSVLGKLKDIDPLAYERERIQTLFRLVQNRSEHIRASFEHFRTSWRRQVVIFLDNIDQRSSEDQDQVFLISNELASTWPATVFVTLRPETFYKSTRSGALSGYQARVFTISPPRTDIMLTRRVDFALKQIKETGRLGSYPAGVTVDSVSLTNYLEVLAENFRGNERIVALIDNLAGGNMRLALEFVTDFIGSGHVNTGKILDIYERSGAYTIAVHEFLRALLFKDHEYYDPHASSIANLFRVTTPDAREHFLLPLLLTHIQVRGETANEAGYVLASEVYTFAQGLGFEPSQIESALSYAEEKRLIDSAPRHTGQSERIYYRITTVGAYTTRVLPSQFAYIDAVLIDTPVLEQAYQRVIEEAHTISERVGRAKIFRVYLDKQWLKMQTDNLPWLWSETSRKLSDDIDRAEHNSKPSSRSRSTYRQN